MKSPFIFVFLGVLLVVAIALASLIKTFVTGFDQHGKKPYFTGFLFAVLIALSSFLTAFLLKDRPFIIYWVLTAIFIMFGAIQFLITHKKYFTSEVSRYKTLAGEFIYTGAVMLFSMLFFTAIQFFLMKETAFLFYPVLLSFLVLFIPLLFTTTFYEAGSIPASYFPVLEYPEVSKESPDDNPNERLLVIGFEIAKISTDSRSYFRARTPDDILLGDLFYFFINDYNETQSETPIQYKDADDHNYKWWFRLKPKWYQSERVLDPEQSMKDNHVVENSIIICERL